MENKDLRIVALADFLDVSIKGIETGDVEGTASLYTEMASVALDMGIALPFQATIANAVATGKPFGTANVALLAQFADGLRQAAQAD